MRLERKTLNRGAYLLFAGLCLAVSLGWLGAGSARATPAIDAFWGNSETNGSGVGGLFSPNPHGVAANWATGDVYVADTGNHRIQRFAAGSTFAAGIFLDAWGRDVDQTGGSGGAEICQAPAPGESDHCKAGSAGALGGEFSEPAGMAIDQASGSLYVIDSGNRRVQEFDSSGQFVRAFGWDVVASGPGDDTDAPEDEFEVCNAAANDTCKAGVVGSSGGAFGGEGFGAFGGNVAKGAGSGLAVAPAGAPNAGHVLVADSINRRVQEFDSSGQFVRAFGWDVVASGPGDDTDAPEDEFEVCNAGADVCQAGSDGAGKGQFAGTSPTHNELFPAAGPTRVAEDSSGRIYTVEAGPNHRVQRFTLPGNVPTPLGEFAAAALHGSVDSPTASSLRNNTTEVAVDTAGNVYVVKAFPVGTGTPPVVILPLSLPPQWQQRVLKLDPVSEEVTATMAANPGLEDGLTLQSTSALAVAAGGAPLYALTWVDGSMSGFAPRVWRLNEISGPAATEVRATEVKASTATLRAAVSPAQIPLSTLYRFEYSPDGVTWKPAPAVDAELGNGSAGGVAGTCPLPQAATCEVSQSIGGLTPGVSYRLRLVVSTSLNLSGAQTVEGEEFTTTPEPPVANTGASTWSSPATSGPSLLLGGTVNPGNARTTFQFEYADDASFQADKSAGGSGFEHAAVVPAAPTEAGRGLETADVHEVVAGLDPSLLYHYRLVATNSVGTTTGAERSVAPPEDGARFFELVSRGDSGGGGIGSIMGSIADSGERATFPAQAFNSPSSVPSFINDYVAVRGADGWTVPDTAPDGEHAGGQGAEKSADLGRVLSLAGTVGEQSRGEGQLQLTAIDGSKRTLIELAPSQLSGSGSFRLVSAAADLSRAFIEFNSVFSSAALLPGEIPPSKSRSNLYEVGGLDGASPGPISILNRADGKAGAVLGAACGANLPEGPYAVVADGSAAYFTIYEDAPDLGELCPESQGGQRLYQRIGGETTLKISKSECTRSSPACSAADGDDLFKGASADGQVVFFTTTRQLANSDLDATADLYVYDRDPPVGQPSLMQASAGETVGSHTAGSGAKVLGTLDLAGDGSRIYFVAEGVLTGPNLRGKAPTGGAKNLYVFERDAGHPAGRVGFVGALTSGEPPGGDQREWGVGEPGGKQAVAMGPGGRALLLVTKSKLTEDDKDTAKDLYRYDDAATEAVAQLVCLSCQGAPGAPVGAGNGNFEVRVNGHPGGPQADYEQKRRVASADLATVVFATREKLAAEDENETWDAYAWHEGQVQMISMGSGTYGMPDNSSNQVAIAPDGKDVFFFTRAALVGSDTNGTIDLYDARVGGGFPEAARPASCGDAEACQGPTSGGGNQSPLGPGSASFSGPGDQVSPPKRPRCPKGKVRRGGRCVKKHGQGGGKKGKRGAGNGKRSGR